MAAGALEDGAGLCGGDPAGLGGCADGVDAAGAACGVEVGLPEVARGAVAAWGGFAGGGCAEVAFVAGRGGGCGGGSSEGDAGDGCPAGAEVCGGGGHGVSEGE